MREFLLLALLLASGVLVSVGVGLAYAPAGLVVGGAALAALSLFALRGSAPPDEEVTP